MTYAKIALALLGIVKWLMGEADRRRAFGEGERAQFARDLAAVAHAGGVADEVAAEVAAMSRAEKEEIATS
jgi:hypothetical protein